MGFIHGEVNWVDEAGTTSASVDKMLAVVDHYPWSSRSSRVSSEAPVAVLAAQYLPHDGFMPDPVAQGIDIVADVRLHERERLSASMGLSPADGRQRADTSLIGLAYRLWGQAFAARLLGDGAFALWDAEVREMICWRDPMGVRPLYYYHEPGIRFVFSSDLQSMAAHPGIPNRLDLAYVRGLLDSGGRLMHPTRTLVAGVRKVPAGHHLVAGPEGVRLHRYWHPEGTTERRHRHDADYATELRELIDIAVRCRMPASAGGTGVGAHLTGGLDSSSLAVLAARALTAPARPLRAFSWAPSWEDVPEVDGDERHLVDAVVGSAPIEMRFTRLLPEDIIDAVCRDIALKPLTTLLYEFAASRDAAAVGVGTMLSGWGGDETVAYNARGYFASLARRGRFLKIQRELRMRAEIHGGSLLGAWKARVVAPNLPDLAVRKLGWWNVPDTAAWPGELLPDLAHLLRSVEPLEAPLTRERPGVRRTQLQLLEQGHLQYRAESWAAHGASLGITYAFPLLDRRLVEFALSIPDRLYFQNGWKRWLYRTAMEGILPEPVRWNPHKFDQAMVHQYRRTKPAAMEGFRQRFLERADNGLVDTDVLLANSGFAPRGNKSVPTLQGPVGDAAWMAFTELRP